MASGTQNKGEAIEIEGKTYYILREIEVDETVAERVGRFLVVRIKGGSKHLYVTEYLNGEYRITGGNPKTMEAFYGRKVSTA